MSVYCMSLPPSEELLHSGVYSIFCSNKFLFQGSMTVLENSDFKQEMWYIIEILGRVLVSSSHRMQQKDLEIPDFCCESSVSKHSCMEGFIGTVALRVLHISHLGMCWFSLRTKGTEISSCFHGCSYAAKFSLAS